MSSTLFEFLHGTELLYTFERLDEPSHSFIGCKTRVCGQEEHRIFPPGQDIFNRHGTHLPDRSPHAGAFDADPSHIPIGEAHLSGARGDFPGHRIDDFPIAVRIGFHIGRWSRFQKF